jgi:hypothetical protein
MVMETSGAKRITISSPKRGRENMINKVTNAVKNIILQNKCFKYILLLRRKLP